LGGLAFEALPGDVAYGRVEDADLIVEDERAETKRAERALEEDPRRARPGAVDAGEPRANGARVALSDEWTGGRCGGCDRHASLSETIDDAPGWPAERPRRVIGEGRQEGKRGRPVLARERPQRLFELGRWRRRQRRHLRGPRHRSRRQPVIEQASAVGVSRRLGRRRHSNARPKKR